MANELVVQDAQETQSMTVAEVGKQVQMIQQLMKTVMQDGQHYGKIPGCGPKPTLLKSGAEKINFLFRLGMRSPQIDIRELGNGHREYVIRVELYHLQTGNTVGAGVGSCSTMETKYRYRRGENGRYENPDIADQYNTCLKMAKKRAYVDATLSSTAASDFFTQDIEEMDIPQQTKQEPARATHTQASQSQTPSKTDKKPETMAAVVKSVKIPTDADKFKCYIVTFEDGQTAGTYIGETGQAVALCVGKKIEFEYVVSQKGNKTFSEFHICEREPGED